MRYHVDKVIKQLEYGATEPYEAVIEKDLVVIKTFNNKFSNKILINEFICLKLAQIVGLTIPNGGICVVDDNTIMNQDVIDDLAYSMESIDGVGFYSKKLNSATVFDSDESAVPYFKNCDEINKIIIFDYLIYNVDRHEGNLLVNLKSSEMYIIDHSHVFKDKYTWTSRSLKKNMEKKDFEDLEILEGNFKTVYEPFLLSKIIKKSLLVQEAKRFKILINKDVLDNIFDQIPKEWINGYEEDLFALKDYILYRVNNIEVAVNIIINFMQMEGGIFYEN